MARIARITAARITKYLDNGETRAYVTWVDTRGNTGTTEGLLPSAHMDALLARARREGVRVVRDKAGWTPGMAGGGWNPNRRRGSVRRNGSEPESRKIEWEQLPKMFGLPASDDLFEGVADSGTYSAAYDEAINDGLSEEEAEQKAQEAEHEVQDDLYKQYKNAVENVAESFFEKHGLGMNDLGDGYVEIFPEKSWRDAADKIRETINGVGMFEFNDVDEFLESGPYSPDDAVMKHLHWIKDYARVYGDRSPRDLFDRAMR